MAGATVARANVGSPLFSMKYAISYYKQICSSPVIWVLETRNCNQYWFQTHCKVYDVNKLEFHSQLWFFCSLWCLSSIPGVPKKRNNGFSVPCELKVLYFFTSLDKASSAEENDTKIIKFGWVILILCPFLQIQSFSNFAWFFATDERRIVSREKPSIWCFVEAHWSVFLLLPRINGLPKTPYGRLFPIILHSSVAKIKRNLKMIVFLEVGIDSKLLKQI